jgi:hypothetical protein
MSIATALGCIRRNGGQVFSRDTAGFFRDIERVFVNCRSVFARASVEHQDFSRASL